MRKIKFIIERKLSSIILLVLTIIAILIIILLSKQPSFPFLQDTLLNQTTHNFAKVYDFAWDVSIGFIISLIFYLIVVYIPESQKRKDVEKVINAKCEKVIISSYSLINEIIKNSNLNYQYKTLTKNEMAEICKAVNPLDYKYKFAQRIDNMYESHFGYKIANDWKRINGIINEIIIFIPLIDTGILNRLNALSEHFLKYFSKDLEISENINITSLGAFSDSFFDFYILTKKLRDYYLFYSNNSFNNDPWK